MFAKPGHETTWVTVQLLHLLICQRFTNHRCLRLVARTDNLMQE